MGRSGDTTDLVLDQVIVSDAALQPLPFTIANAKITIAANDDVRDPLQPSIALRQDLVDGAAGVTKGIARIGDPTNAQELSAQKLSAQEISAQKLSAQKLSAQELNILLGSFQVPITYNGRCVNILGVRGLDFTVSDVSWIHLAGGLWADPNNWNAGRVPDKQDTVFNTLNGSSTVIVNGSQSADSVTIGGRAGRHKPFWCKVRVGEGAPA